jgi:hypothetical protein
MQCLVRILETKNEQYTSMTVADGLWLPPYTRRPSAAKQTILTVNRLTVHTNINIHLQSAHNITFYI